MRVLLLPLISTCMVSLAGCSGGVAAGMIGAEDAALLEEARTLIFSFSSDASCADLVNEDPAGIGDKLGGAPLQLVDPDEESYTFGKVPANTDVAYLVLVSAASKAELGNRPQFDTLEGTVFGIGCRDLNAASGTRQDLPITVFAAGLR
jgi:hypothetical protein